ncbi:MAG: hypothetical protein WC683_02975 [bacterium]
MSAMNTYGIPPNCRKCGRLHEQADFDRYARLAERNGHAKPWTGKDGKGVLCALCFLEALDDLCHMRDCGSCKMWESLNVGCCHIDQCGPPNYPLWECDGEPVNLSRRGIGQ